MSDLIDTSGVELDVPQSQPAYEKFGGSPVAPAPVPPMNLVATDAKTAFGSPSSELPHPPAAPVAASPAFNPSKQLDFGVPPATPSTPPPVTAAYGSNGGTGSSSDVDYNTFILETLLWTNKIRSAFYFVAGLLAWLVVRAIFLSPTTLFTGTCYTLLFSLAFNFFRGVMAPKYQERCTWSHSAWTNFLSSLLTTSVAAAAALHDRHLSGLDPLHTLEVGLGLWPLSVLGRALDAVTLLLLIHLGAFTLPLAYHANKAQVDGVVRDVYGQVQAQYSKVDRRIKAAAMLALGLVLFMVLPAVDRFVAVFIVLAYGRAILKPNEYAAVQKRIEPVAAIVTNAGNTASNVAANLANKYDITPTPSKKKQL